MLVTLVVFVGGYAAGMFIGKEKTFAVLKMVGSLFTTWLNK